MSGSAPTGEDDEPAPQLRHIFAGFTYKHANWMASLGRTAANPGTDATTNADDPVLLSGTPLGAADDDVYGIPVSSPWLAPARPAANRPGSDPAMATSL